MPTLPPSPASTVNKGDFQCLPYSFISKLSDFPPGHVACLETGKTQTPFAEPARPGSLPEL